MVKLTPIQCAEDEERLIRAMRQADFQGAQAIFDTMKRRRIEEDRQATAPKVVAFPGARQTWPEGGKVDW